MPIKGKTEKLLDGHGKQLLQAGAALRAEEGPYPADEEGRKRDPSDSLFHMCKSKQEDLNGLLLMFIEEVSNAARTWQLRWVCGNVCSSCQWLCDFQTLPDTGKCEHAWGSQRELALSSQVFEVRSRAKSQNSSLTTQLLSRINLVNSMTAATS